MNIDYDLRENNDNEYISMYIDGLFLIDVETSLKTTVWVWNFELVLKDCFKFQTVCHLSALYPEILCYFLFMTL